MRAVIVWLAWILAGFREEFRRAGRMVPGGRELCAKTPFAKSRKGARNIHLIFIGSPPWRVPIHDNSWFTQSPAPALSTFKTKLSTATIAKFAPKDAECSCAEFDRELRQLRFADAARTQRYSWESLREHHARCQPPGSRGSSRRCCTTHRRLVPSCPRA